MTQAAQNNFNVGMSASSAEEVNRMLEDYAKQFHLVSPATSCGYLPPGCMVVFSFVKVDPDPKNKEVYKIPASADVGIGKVALQRISNAAAITWGPGIWVPAELHKRAYTAMGMARHFDGSPMILTGYHEDDLSEGSAEWDLIYKRHEIALAKWERSDKREDRPKDPELSILEKRKNLSLNCETKAKLRAIRSMGIKTSYSPKELEKAFAIARLHNMAAAAAQYENAMAAMYGLQVPRIPQARTIRALPAPAHELPQPTTFDTDGVVNDPPPPPKSEPRPVERKPEPAAPPPAQTQRQAPPPPPRNDAPPDDDDPAVPFGKNKGIPLRELNEKQLNAYVQMLKENVADASKARWRQSNEEHLAMFEREVARRQGGQAPAAPPPPPDDAPLGDDDLPFDD